VRILPNSPTPQLPVVAATPRRIRGEPAQALRERAGEGWLVAARALIDGLLDAVWLVDPDNLHIVAANRAAGELIGVEAGSLCGQDSDPSRTRKTWLSGGGGAGLDRQCRCTWSPRR
jgi:PAS domain-containing protein